ncbi:MAG TPA: sigma-70 family RNA polymerase sigma factor [Nocardioides sp.]|uniref:RNA polymerase sigma factor n=1 Tax=Nocardioides sp. TaxID=35761 RepID=UPI002D7EB555|nr:sigma-70 family RNA polymerase sigma factor [Nocardioides sp.]HET6652027.1 sigma-70 family RNA polymerase sigma factor [Nocardioides sp.]
MSAPCVDDVWRREAPHVLGALLRRHGDYGDCEDAAQEALVAALQQWPLDGTPDNPRGWLVRVASRRLVDRQRARTTRERRELTDALATRLDEDAQRAVDGPGVATDRDDSLRLLLMCCHESLSRPSQVALTLRAVSGLSVEAIAAAYLVPARTMTQRLTRARATLREAGARFTMPTPEELPARVAAVLDVCHLVFNEGYTRTSGDRLVDTDLADEAIRLTRLLHEALPDHDEVSGALALMLLTHARTASRVDGAGGLVPLSDQDRTHWDRAMIADGVALLEEVLPRGHAGRYQLQAAIAAVHAEACTWPETDWLQISLLYAMLHDVAPSPAVTLNRAVAVGMARGPTDGLALVDTLLDDPAMRRHHRTHAVRAHLLEMAGDTDAALPAYREAARLTASLPEQRYLNAQVDRLSRS